MPPLSSVDLLAPEGDLEVSWFLPLDSVEVNRRIEGWLTQGYKHTDGASAEALRDDVAKSFAYYKAYEHIATSLARRPNTVTFNESGAKTHSSEDPKYFLDLSRSWYDVFASLAPVAAPASDFTPSASVKHRIRF